MIKYLKFLTACVGFIALVQCAESPTGYASSKIVGGKKAEMTPYQISLQLFAPTEGFLFFIPAKNWTHVCGGAIVNEFYIVTAAHCVKDKKPDKLSVLAGITNLKEENKVQRHLVEHCLVHPDYVALNHSDIAVCRMKIQFKFGTTIAPIKLDKTEVAGGQNCILSGWGYTFAIRGTPAPDDLQEGNFTTITNEECIKAGIPVGPKELCTAAVFWKGACGGDSGGPLYCNGALAGVTSYGYEICAFGQPDVFTRVSKYVDWINLNTILGAVSVSSIASTLSTNFTNNIFG